VSNINKVIVLGRLGKDPEHKDLGGGNSLCKFSVATTESWKDKQGNKQEETEWHNITAFGKLAEICSKYLKKGSLVYVEGKNKTSTYEKNGETRYSTEVRISEMKMIGDKPKSEDPF